eukprot:COSAG02_NODE_6695_length_3418_cov_1.764086_2_plen_83_part_00
MREKLTQYITIYSCQLYIQSAGFSAQTNLGCLYIDMNDAPDEDYAQQCDPMQSKSRRPRPKKEVTKVVPAKIFDGIGAHAWP